LPSEAPALAAAAVTTIQWRQQQKSLPKYTLIT
jgi:hypothetical protein